MCARVGSSTRGSLPRSDSNRSAPSSPLPWTGVRRRAGTLAEQRPRLQAVEVAHAGEPQLAQLLDGQPVLPQALGHLAPGKAQLGPSHPVDERAAEPDPSLAEPLDLDQ